MIRKKVILSGDEVSKAQDLAKKRDEKKRYFGAGKYGVCSSKTGSSEKSHLIGILGELATAKYFSVEVDEEIFDTHGDDGVDLNIPKLGGTVQVKTTTYTKNPFLRVPMGTEKDKSKIENSNSFVCCCIDAKDLTNVDIVGWIDREALKESKTKRFLSGGPLNYVVEENELNEMP